jgi:hypothetical protein
MYFGLAEAAGVDGCHRSVCRFMERIESVVSLWVFAACNPLTSNFGFMPMNGGSGVLAIAGGNIIQAMSFEIADNRVRAIYIVRNPDKLRHLREVAL